MVDVIISMGYLSEEERNSAKSSLLKAQQNIKSDRIATQREIEEKARIAAEMKRREQEIKRQQQEQAIVLAQAQTQQQSNFQRFHGINWSGVSTGTVSTFSTGAWDVGVNSKPFTNASSAIGYSGDGLSFIGTYMEKSAANVFKEIKPKNIGVGTWNKLLEKESVSIIKDAQKFSKVSKVAGGASIAVNVGIGVYDNLKAGAPVGQIVSDATVDTAFSLGGLGASAAAAAKAGQAFGPYGGVVGGIVGGVVYTLGTDVITFNGNTIPEIIKEKIDNMNGGN